MLNKVPEVTIFFWVIKVMATTVGETAADFLNVDLGFGLTNTSVVMAVLLAVALAVQLTRDRYVPAVYWLTVVLISVVGTLVTDFLTDVMHVPLLTSTSVFSALLLATFAAWYASERTLSIHTVFTRRRELYYWTAILFTFALGTAGGDYASEGLGWGYATGTAVFGVLIAAIAIGHGAFRLNAVLAFWLAYILTRPLGASLGDLMSQAPSDGGLGWSSSAINGTFLATIVALVVYLSWTKVDRTENRRLAVEAPGATACD